MTHTHRLAPAPRLAVLAAFLLLSGCVEQETAQTDGQAAEGAVASSIYGSDPIENGRTSYVTYCAACHGTTGVGDGPVAPSLTTPATDLTQLVARYGGTFAADSIYAYIDGRQDVQAHGTRQMPVWGNIWIEEDGQPVLQEVVDRRISELVEYLRTIQAADSTAAS